MRLSLSFSKYYFGLTAVVTIFALSMLSISYKPTCFFNDGLRTPNCAQNSSDKSNLSNIKISLNGYRFYART